MNISGLKLLSLQTVLTFLLTIGCSDSKNTTNSCIEPLNPYKEGTAHSEGYMWAAQNGQDCNGSSDPFNQGCEEYKSQEVDYVNCVDGNK